MVASGEEMRGQNRQCTFIVTLSRFRATIVAVEKQ